MSRLDDHVAAVQNKLALGRFADALAWGSLAVAGAVWLGVLLDRILLLSPPHPALWIIAAAIAAIIGAIGYAAWKRPDKHQAAVAIDEKLGLKEKISTALYVRPMNEDPFAAAAVSDAEATARELALNLRRHFPLRFPRAAIGAAVVALLALGTWYFVDPMQLFGREEKRRQMAEQQRQVEQARQSVQKALAQVEALARTLPNQEQIKLARAELQAALNQPINDPAQAKRTAVMALADVNKALKEQIKNSEKFAEAQSQAKMFRSMQVPTEGQGPVADAQRAIVKGEFTEATNELSKAVESFDKMDNQQQKKAAQQMAQMAQQLQQMANNPQQQQQLQQQLQQMGMNQQQAQQAQQLMQQAAQGDPKAQQQLQQVAQRAMQQMNNGQGPSPQQQQQIQQMMQQMQAQMNTQQQAQQMAQAAQQMAQAMQQAAQAQQNQQGSQQGQQQGQQMQQAMGQMQQQLQQMQAAAQDAQQIAAAQAQAAAAQSQAQDAMGGNRGGQQGNGANGQWNPNANIQGNGQQQGQWQGQQGFAGPNQGGIGAGDRTYKEQAPFSVKQEVSPSQEDEKGRIIASNYIKDNKPLKGQASLSLKDVAEAAQKEQTDEVDQERISRQAQQSVKRYFSSMEQDGGTAAGK